MSPKRLQRVVTPNGEPKQSDGWRTPRPCFDALHDEFNFGLDLAASPHDALCSEWLGPGSRIAEDALAMPVGAWRDAFFSTTGQAAWLNPPYSSALIKRFLASVVEEAELGLVAVVLVPYTPDTQWWQHVERAVEIRRIPHRVPYLKADGIRKTGAMFPSCIAVFRPQPGIMQPAAPRYVAWTWRQVKDDATREGRMHSPRTVDLEER